MHGSTNKPLLLGSGSSIAASSMGTRRGSEKPIFVHLRSKHRDGVPGHRRAILFQLIEQRAPRRLRKSRQHPPKAIAPAGQIVMNEDAPETRHSDRNARA